MTKQPMTYGEAVLTDIAVGAVAGLVAAGAMHAFQVAWTTLIAKPSGTPATQRAADAISEAVTGDMVAEENKNAAGNVVHYGTGAILGATYGLMAGLMPFVTAGRGLLFGAAVFGLGDELAVPALGFGRRASQTPAEDHAYSAASHAVFALTLDAVRRALNKRISTR